MITALFNNKCLEASWINVDNSDMKTYPSPFNPYVLLLRPFYYMGWRFKELKMP